MTILIVRPTFLSYLINEYYDYWVREFHFGICQPTLALLLNLFVHPILDAKVICLASVLSLENLVERKVE